MKTGRSSLIVSLLFFCVFAFGGKTAEAITLTPVRLEISGEPGQILTEEITIINEQVTAETFYSSLANFEAEGESGNPVFRTPTEGIGTWITAPESVFMPSGVSKVVPITISIPSNAKPGGYFGAIFWGAVPEAGAPGEVAIGAKTGVLVLLSIKGDVEEGGGLLDFDTKDGKKLYNSLPINFTYRFRNDGADRVKPEGDIAIKNIFGATASLVPANKVEGNVLPTQVRRFETTWVGSRNSASTESSDVRGFFNQAKYEWQNFAIGPYTANMALAYGTKNQIAEAKVTLWVLPWHFLIVFIVLLWIVLFVLQRGLRAYNRRIIRQANLNGTQREDNSYNQRR